jgi:phosphate transport system substrate-binding protein
MIAGSVSVAVSADRWYKAVILPEESDLTRFTPFLADNDLATLDEEASIHFSSDLPHLDGATALYPVYAAFTQATYRNNEVDYSADQSYSPGSYATPRDEQPVVCSTTSGAFANLFSGLTDVIFVMGVSEDDLKYAESYGMELELTPIGREAFVFLVNERNPVDNLSVEQVKAIYSGEISNWHSVGGNWDSITAFQRPYYSGSQTAMEQIMGDVSLKSAPSELTPAAMGGLARAVADYRNFPDAIGYSFRYYVESMAGVSGIKLLSIDGVAPTPENIASGAYPFTQDFYAVSVKGGAQATRDYGGATPGRTANAERLIEWATGPPGQ